MWMVKGLLAVVTLIAVGWICIRMLRGRNPEKEVARLEARLLSHLRNSAEEKRIARDWLSLCQLIRQGVLEGNPALAQRGMEAVKLFVGEYSRKVGCSEKDMAIMLRELASLYSTAIKSYPDLAMETVVALRVIAREMQAKDGNAYQEIVAQLSLFGNLALREKQAYITAKILDQIFLLFGKRGTPAAAKTDAIVVQAVGQLGEAAIHRRDIGLIREIIARLGQTEDIKIYTQSVLGSMLLKAIRVRFDEAALLILEASTALAAEEQGEQLRETLKTWTEAAKNALISQNQLVARMITVKIISLVEQRLQEAAVAELCINELFSVVGLVLRDQTSTVSHELLLPVLELGRRCMWREIKGAVITSSHPLNQHILKLILDKLLHTAAVVSRSGNVTTGQWIASLYTFWLGMPDSQYRQESSRKFMQLWVLYWLNAQRRSAKRQGGAPLELFTETQLSKEEVACFPDLHIRVLDL